MLVSFSSSGKYVFGCFDNSDMTEKYKIDYNS